MSLLRSQYVARHFNSVTLYLYSVKSQQQMPRGTVAGNTVNVKTLPQKDTPVLPLATLL